MMESTKSDFGAQVHDGFRTFLKTMGIELELEPTPPRDRQPVTEYRVVGGATVVFIHQTFDSLDKPNPKFRIRIHTPLPDEYHEFLRGRESVCNRFASLGGVVTFEKGAEVQTQGIVNQNNHQHLIPLLGTACAYGAPSILECLRHSLEPDNEIKVIPQRSVWTPPVMQDIAYEYSHMGGVNLFHDHVAFHQSSFSRLELWPTDNNRYWGGGLLALTIVEKGAVGALAEGFDVNLLNIAANLNDEAPTLGAWCDEGSELIFASFLPNLFGNDPKFNNYFVAWARDRVNLLPDLVRVALGDDE